MNISTPCHRSCGQTTIQVSTVGISELAVRNTYISIHGTYQQPGQLQTRHVNYRRSMIQYVGQQTQTSASDVSFGFTSSSTVSIPMSFEFFISQLVQNEL